MVHRAGAVLLALVVLGGCSGSPASPEAPSDAPTPSASAAATADAVATYTVAELRAALPRLADVPGGSRRTSKCPDAKRAKECTIDNGTVVSVNFELERPSTGSAAGDEATLGDLAIVSVTEFDSIRAKRKAIAGYEKSQSDYNGDFATEAVAQGSSSYTLGERGTGSKRALALNGWQGSGLDRKIVLVDLDGQASGRRIDARQYLNLGKVVLSVSVTFEAVGHTRAGASDLTDRLAGDYLTRLREATDD